MLDRPALALVEPLLARAGRWLAGRGIGADAVTWSAFALGLLAALAIARGHALAGLALLLGSRAADGLDGAVARATRPTDRGAFLDITLDFLFYASIPLAFALADPGRNALPAALLLAAFIGTGSSFLAFAVLAERRGLSSRAYPGKGLYYLGGLTEGTETLACFALMCLVPQHFAWWAGGFAALCVLTTATRVLAGWRLLDPRRAAQGPSMQDVVPTGPSTPDGAPTASTDEGGAPTLAPMHGAATPPAAGGSEPPGA